MQTQLAELYLDNILVLAVGQSVKELDLMVDDGSSRTNGHWTMSEGES